MFTVENYNTGRIISTHAEACHAVHKAMEWGTILHDPITVSSDADGIIFNTRDICDICPLRAYCDSQQTFICTMEE